MLRDAVLEEEVGQYPEDVVGGHPPGHRDRQALAGVLIDDGEQAQGTPVVGLLADEVISPDVVAMLRPQTDAGAIGQPETAALRLFGRHLQAL